MTSSVTFVDEHFLHTAESLGVEGSDKDSGFGFAVGGRVVVYFANAARIRKEDFVLGDLIEVC